MYIKIRVQAGAKKESVAKRGEHTFDISVKEPAKNNLANKRVTEVIAEHYTVPIRSVRLISGHRSPSKILLVPDR